MMTIHFNANLRPIVGNRVGMLHWIADPLASGFIIAYDLSGNSVLISNFDVSSWIFLLTEPFITASDRSPGDQTTGRELEPRTMSSNRHKCNWEGYSL